MKTRLLFTMLIVALAGMGTSLVACSSDDDDTGNNQTDAGKDSGPQVDSGPGAAATFTEVYNEVLSKRCQGCHVERLGDAGPAPQGKLSLKPQSVAYTELVGIAAAGAACGPASDAGSQTRVVAGSSPTSLLYNKVRKDQAPPCGAHMPKPPAGGTDNPISDDQVQLIKSWINDGAKNN